MGYTHYWGHPKQLPAAKFKEFMLDCVRIVGFAEGEGIELTGYESSGADFPVFSDDEVTFNGMGSKAHETFCVTREPQEFAFCKTAFKPYDKVVVACLMAAHARFGEHFTWSSDGGDDEHADGRALFERALPREGVA